MAKQLDNSTVHLKKSLRIKALRELADPVVMKLTADTVGYS
jgi:hypothetical protein